jgi:hypothetical protein
MLFENPVVCADASPGAEVFQRYGAWHAHTRATSRRRHRDDALARADE